MEFAVGSLVVFVAYSAVMVMAGYHWRKWEGELAKHDRQAARISMLSKL